MAIPSASYAAESVSAAASVDNASKTVTITGNISSGQGRQVTVLVVNPSGGTDYVDQTASGANGSYRFTYVLDETAGGTYTVSVGGTGIDSPVSATFTYTPDTAVSDTAAPTWPAGSTITASGVSKTGLTLTWTAAQDNTAVTNYKIYTGSNLLQTIAGNITSYAVTGLAAGMTYTFKVEAGDAAGNWSTNGPTVTVTTSSGGGGNGSGGSTATPSATPTPGPPQTGGGIITVTSPGTGTTASVTVAEKTIADSIAEAVAAAKTAGTAPKVEIKITAPAEATTVEVSLPRAGINALADGRIENLVISNPVASISLDRLALSAIADAAEGDVKISASVVAPAALPAAIAQEIGDRPVFDFTITSGNTTISDFAGGKATVDVPYILKAGEDPNAVVVYYLDGSGQLAIVQGVYKDGSVRMVLGHFSKYIIGYNKVSFTDVTNQWFAPAVNFIAAREITSGVGNDLFAPNAVVTRGQFITILCRAYGIVPMTGDNFTDAGNTYYTGYLAAAKQLGISGGVGNNRFAPGNEITREEMFTLLYNALKVLKNLPSGSGKKLSDFTDGGDVSSWAVDAVRYLVENGVVAGSDGKLTPKDRSSRGQMAQIFYNMMSR